MRHLSNDEYQRLFLATGELVIHWGLVEESVNMMSAIIYQLAGGKHLEPELQIMLSRRIRFLRLCFNRLEALASFKDEATKLLDELRNVTELRETLCHSALNGISDNGFVLFFASSRPHKSRSHHYLDERQFQPEYIQAGADSALMLADRAGDLLQRLHDTFVGEKPNTEVPGGL